MVENKRSDDLQRKNSKYVSFVPHFNGLLKRVFQILNQPHFGYEDLRIYFRMMIGISVVVFLILSILQPFDMAQRSIFHNNFITALVYAGGAAITMSLGAIWIIIFPNWFSQKKWTIGKEMMVVFYQVAGIAFTIWLINKFRGQLKPAEATYARSLFLVFTIGILPYIIVTFIRHNYLLKINLAEAERINQQLKSNEVLSKENATTVLNIPKLLMPILLDELLFVEAKGNNLLFQSLKNGQLISHTIRGTLSEFAQNNQQISSLFRCHRSYIINTEKVQHIQGNAAGYQVTLHPQLPTIMVARSNVSAFKSIMHNKT